MTLSLGHAKLLEKDAMLASLARCEKRPRASSAGQTEPWLGLGLEDDSWAVANDLFGLLPPWQAKAGILASPPRRYLVYLEPQAGLESYSPSTLVLDLERGRFSVQTWDCALASRTGLEIASAPPLVCAPPCFGAPLVILVEAIDLGAFPR